VAEGSVSEQVNFVDEMENGGIMGASNFLVFQHNRTKLVIHAYCYEGRIPVVRYC
jgi:hypothetical protein